MFLWKKFTNCWKNMELKAKGSFYRDLSRLANRELAVEVQKVLWQIKQAKDISQIPNLKKLKKFDVHYRIYKNLQIRELYLPSTWGYKSPLGVFGRIVTGI